MKSNIDIVLPVYNPHNGWEHDVIARFQELKSLLKEKHDLRLILVNDGSPKQLCVDVAAIVAAFSDTLSFQYDNNRGKGYALRKGIEASSAPVVMFTDYDFPYEVSSMYEMITRFFDEKLEIAIAQRDDSYYSHIVKKRSIISNTLKTINKILLRLPVSDTQGGLKMFNYKGRQAFLETTTDRYLIDIDFLKRAHKKGLAITPIVVKLRSDIELTEMSNMRLLKELKSYLKILLSW